VPVRIRARRPLLTPRTARPTGYASPLADQIISVLEQRPLMPARWREKALELEREHGLEAYAVLLSILTHLEFRGDVARTHWNRILEQWEALNGALEGGVDLRVAVLHYFVSTRKELKNPAIVEIKILQKTRETAIVDDLTQIYNFRYFQDRIDSEARRADRYSSSLALLMLDIDDFKAYNDNHGHLAGNDALRRLARILTRSVREVDVVSRYGGEEFGVILPNTPKEAALRVAEKVRRSVEKAAIGRDRGVNGLTVSVGVACLPGDARGAKELVEKADSALYVAKSLGKNRVRLYSEERREFYRVEAALVGKVGLLEDQSHPLTTLNVSDGGILFSTRHPLDVGSMVQLELKLNKKNSPALECVVRVVRVIEEAHGYEVGAKIIDMDRDTRRRFQAFVKARRPSGPPNEKRRAPARAKAR
jgi:diguanylate cyclase (GGDEF)-like protein